MTSWTIATITTAVLTLINALICITIVILTTVTSSHCLTAIIYLVIVILLSLVLHSAKQLTICHTTRTAHLILNSPQH